MAAQTITVSKFGEIPASTSFSIFEEYLNKGIYISQPPPIGIHRKVTLGTSYTSVDLTSIFSEYDKEQLNSGFVWAQVIFILCRHTAAGVTIEYCNTDTGAAYSKVVQDKTNYSHESPYIISWWIKGINISNMSKFRLKATVSTTFEYTVLVFFRHTGASENYDDDPDEES